MVHNRNSNFHLNKHQNANHGFLIHLHGYAIGSKNKENGIIMRYDIIGLYYFEKKMDDIEHVLITNWFFSL